MSLHEDRRSSFKISATRAMFSRVLVVVGLPLLCSSWIDSHPSENMLLPMKHSSTMYSRLTINFLNHFKCFCGIKPAFQQKRIAARCSVVFFHYDLWSGQNRQVTSLREYVPHCEWFKWKHSMHREEGLLKNFPKFCGDCATSTMFSQSCCKTYRIDLVFIFSVRWPLTGRTATH